MKRMGMLAVLFVSLISLGCGNAADETPAPEKSGVATPGQPKAEVPQPRETNTDHQPLPLPRGPFQDDGIEEDD